MTKILSSPFDRESFIDFVENFLPDFERDEHPVSTKGILKQATQIGYSEICNLAVFEIKIDAADAEKRIAITQNAFKMLRQHRIRNALIAFHYEAENWRLSLLTSTLEIKDGKIVSKSSNPRRFSYLLGENAKIKTPRKLLIKQGPVSDLKDLQKRFSVDIVNKEFYNAVAGCFMDLVGGERGEGRKKKKYQAQLQLPGADKRELQEFSVRLIGRIMFCWFLKEKKSLSGDSLMPSELLSLEAISKNADYYHNVLEPLFFGCLNTQVSRRTENLQAWPFNQIPYLNGGLFAPQPTDYYKKEPDESVRLPDEWFVKLFTLLNQYNFTVDENTSFDIDLSIDPEMLGRIFENLLAEINPETGKTARKATGSFYTPREIVEYMVDNSLFEFLSSKTTIAPKTLRALISYGEENATLDDAARDEIVSVLADLAILDPACGSGAFPMGILQKVFYILQQVDPEGRRWYEKQIANIPSEELKKDLQSKFEGGNYDYIRKLGIIRQSIFGVDIQTIATEIAKLRCFLTLVIEEQVDDTKDNRGIHPLPNLDFKFVAANSLVGLPGNKIKNANIFDGKEHIAALKKIRNEYFTADEKERIFLRANFAELQNEMFKLRLQNGGATSDKYNALTEWNPFSNKPVPWFDSEWMFGVKDFDIVIGNPPYVDYRNITDESIKADYEIAQASKMINLYNYFYELGLNLLKTDGVLCYISPQQYLVLENCKGVRDLIRKYHLVFLADFSMAEVFEAGTYPFVTLIKKNQERGQAVFREYDQIKNFDSFVRQMAIKNPIPEPVNISKYGAILQKIETGHTLADVVAKSNSIFVASSATQERLPSGEGEYQFLEASNIFDYKIKDIKVSINWTTNYSANSRTKQSQTVIYTSRMTSKIRAVLVDNQKTKFLGGKVNVIVPENNGEIITALLNSKVVNFWFRENFTMTHMQGGALPINADDLRKIPVPEFNGPQYEKVNTLAQKACSTKGEEKVVQELEEAIADWYDLDSEAREIVLASEF